MSEVKLKPFKSFEQQLAKLRSRNLEIPKENEDFALSILMRINYYRFTAYLLPYKTEDDMYLPGTNFNTIYDIYEFDRKLRNITITLLEHIEISFRTYIAYAHSRKFGPDGYLNSSNFINKKDIKTDKDFHSGFCSILKKSQESHKHRLFVMHHEDKYDGIMPLWVATEILTFANISKFYSNLNPSEKSFIKTTFIKLNVDFVENWLEGLTGIRNACAHSHRIYNEKFMNIKIMKRYAELNLDGRKFFAYVLAMKHLTMSDKEWNLFFIELQKLVSEYFASVDLSLLGFPSNWKEVLAEE
ncbi:Abi family protein [Proteiniclasticum sp. BAD-10]|uniref:Abi family protein n=1 Tax=Proteiniclasticum sediminis TaxID=2804028 RepID=A0A941CQA1_9CLOT|nr:Abi family protein [Proteiniclasticum sediminis]MBR0576742.1 Abi family protein [Proteiniclasticum sediminis]